GGAVLPVAGAPAAGRCPLPVGLLLTVAGRILRQTPGPEHRRRGLLRAPRRVPRFVPGHLAGPALGAAPCRPCLRPAAVLPAAAGPSLRASPDPPGPSPRGQPPAPDLTHAAPARRHAPLPAAPLAQTRPWPSLITLVVCLVALAVAVRVLARMQLVSEGLGIPTPGVVFLAFVGCVLLLLFFALTPVLPYLQETATTWSLGGRLVTVLAGLALLVAAWPGWLQVWFDDPWQARRVAWTVEGDPGLRDTAEMLGRLRQEGVLGTDPRGFHLQPQLVNYCAWYCPEEKGFFDQ